LVGSIFHMTRKIVSEMTYNVSMGTLNPTILYQFLPLMHCTLCESFPLSSVTLKFVSHDVEM